MYVCYIEETIMHLTVLTFAYLIRQSMFHCIHAHPLFYVFFSSYFSKDIGTEQAVGCW